VRGREDRIRTVKKPEIFVDNTAQIFLVFCLFGFLFHFAQILMVYEAASVGPADVILKRWNIRFYSYAGFILDALGAFLAIGLLKRKRWAYQIFLNYCLALIVVQIFLAAQVIFQMENPATYDSRDWKGHYTLYGFLMVVGRVWNIFVIGLLSWVWSRFRTESIKNFFKDRQ
ncbi:MAG: hypothetical protein ACREL1_00165, partial [bacterium]